MKCPICNFVDTKVIDSRIANDGLSIRRRRQCLKCDFRFSTYEEMEILDLVVVKKDGRKENYQREKLERGLKKALEKREVSDDDFKKLLHAIERDIQILKKNEISSLEIGQIIMKHLKKVDQVAYIRFASVYKSFNDANEFSQEVKQLNKK